MTLVAEPPAAAAEPWPSANRPEGGGTPERRRGRLRRLIDDRGLCAVLVLVLVWCAVMYLHVWRRHDRFGTFSHDLGFHDHYVWLLARGWSFSTVLGLPAFGHNATFAYYLFAPFSWFGFGPQGLNLVLTASVGLGAVPLYLLARDRIGDAWKAFPVAAIWLLHPVVQGNVWETFHPDSVAMAPLLAAYLCASRRRWRPFGLWLLAAVIWKSDTGMFVAMLGLLVAVRWHRRIGLATMAAGVLWVAVTVGWLIPHLAGGGTVFGPLYGDLGDTPTDVARTALTEPGKVADRLADHDPVQYGRDLLAPFGFLPLLSPTTLALAAPQALVNLLSEAEWTRIWTDSPHYQAVPAVAMGLAMVEGLGRIRRRRREWVGRATALALMAAMAGTVAWGALPPFSVLGHHFWPNGEDPLRGSKEAALAAIPDDAAVSAHYLFVSHLTHRLTIYAYPNPWRQEYYGVGGNPIPDPTGVEFLLMDVNLLDGADRELWDCINESGAFDAVHDVDGIALLERVPGRSDDLACRVPD